MFVLCPLEQGCGNEPRVAGVGWAKGVVAVQNLEDPQPRRGLLTCRARSRQVLECTKAWPPERTLRAVKKSQGGNRSWLSPPLSLAPSLPRGRLNGVADGLGSRLLGSFHRQGDLVPAGQKSLKARPNRPAMQEAGDPGG